MANRHLARSTVLQSLFEWDFGKKTQNEAYEIFERNSKEFADGINEGDKKFMVSLMENVLQKKDDLDFVIEKAAPDWPIDKISIIDLNILRIGLYELLFEDKTQVPPKVAINEAIELAKAFGGESSSRFVNGVLGAVFKEMGEPGKGEKGGKAVIENLPVEKLLGAVIYAKHNDDIYLALVHDVFGHWTLSKGHLEDDEKSEDALKRIVLEELGLNVLLRHELGENEYTAFNPEKGKLRKQVSYFLAESNFDDLKLKESGGLDDAKWFKLKDIIDLNFYDDILPIITKAVNILLGEKD